MTKNYVICERNLVESRPLPSKTRPILVILRGVIGAGKTSVARAIQCLRHDVKIVDVDDSKVRYYGTTEKCNPRRDFPEAGRQARGYLEDGFHTFIIEAFAEKTFVDLSVNETGRNLGDANVVTVWLSCELKTSLQRKGDTVSESMIRHQHARYSGRYRPQGEIVVHTDSLTLDDVAQELLCALGLNKNYLSLQGGPTSPRAAYCFPPAARSAQSFADTND